MNRTKKAIVASIALPLAILLIVAINSTQGASASSLTTASYDYAVAKSATASTALISIDLRHGLTQNSCYTFGVSSFTQKGLTVNIYPGYVVKNTTGCANVLSHKLLPFTVKAKTGDTLTLVSSKKVVTLVVGGAEVFIVNPASSPSPSPSNSAGSFNDSNINNYNTLLAASTKTLPLFNKGFDLDLDFKTTYGDVSTPVESQHIATNLSANLGYVNVIKTGHSDKYLEMIYQDGTAYLPIEDVGTSYYLSGDLTAILSKLNKKDANYISHPETSRITYPGLIGARGTLGSAIYDVIDVGGFDVAKRVKYLTTYKNTVIKMSGVSVVNDPSDPTSYDYKVSFTSNGVFVPNVYLSYTVNKDGFIVSSNSSIPVYDINKTSNVYSFRINTLGASASIPTLDSSAKVVNAPELANAGDQIFLDNTYMPQLATLLVSQIASNPVQTPDAIRQIARKHNKVGLVFTDITNGIKVTITSPNKGSTATSSICLVASNNTVSSSTC
jgi:hypothetical protein